MTRQHASPPGHWSWPFELSHSHAVRNGELVWVGGQLDLDARSRIVHERDLVGQLTGAIANLKQVLASLSCGLNQVVKLLCFYVNDGSVNEDGFLAAAGRCLPDGVHPAVTAVPVDYLPWPGALVSIEAIAMPGVPAPAISKAGQELSPLPAPFASAVRCGKMIFVSGQSPVGSEGEVLHPGDILAQTRQVMSQVEFALAQHGATFTDVVKLNRWYVGEGKTEDFEPAALECAANFSEPGPAATGIPLPRHARAGQLIKIEVVAMLGEDGRPLPRRHVWPDSLWDWTVDIPYYHGLKCHNMIFLGGQVSLDKEGRAINPFNVKAQTAQAMVHIGSILSELGAAYGDICKLTTMYAGPSGLDKLAEHLRIRSSFFEAPGPATTDISLPVLAYPGMIIEIDAFAMAEPDMMA